ncbi:MAG: hypothetical protein FJ115_02050 [Deltaproteobacteria bacterium]|nr:hypothetical protein [Deltaproteobacteria bacterium]MBM4322318.1 hypothetical protein [Deltaproteobacteria bacterium]
MSDKAWTLEEIREAYREVLTLYNELFPLRVREKIDREEIFPEAISHDFEVATDKFRKNLAEKARNLKEAADRSGNAVTWHRGDLLEGLNEGLRKRIEAAIKLGI